MKPRLTILEIIIAATEASNVPLIEITGKKKLRPLPDLRKIICYIARFEGNYKYKEIGAALNRDHTTIISACRQYVDLMITDKIFKDRVSEVRKFLAKERPVQLCNRISYAGYLSV